MKSKNNLNNTKKFNSTLQPLTSRDRLNEVGALLIVSIRRLVRKERDKQDKNSLDFNSKRSVTAALTRLGDENQ